MRSLKTQFSNTATTIYELLLDVLFENSQNAAAASAGQGDALSMSSKKDVFKHLNSMEECRNSLVIQMVLDCQLLNCARQLSAIIKDTVKEWSKS